MQFEERDHSEIRTDGPRMDGRFQWFDRVDPLSAQIDATDLHDLPSTWDFELSGEQWQPGGSISSYAGGPTVPHLRQSMEIPSLAQLVMLISMAQRRAF